MRPAWHVDGASAQARINPSPYCYSYDGYPVGDYTEHLHSIPSTGSGHYDAYHGHYGY